jgi:beta-mannosidase
MPAQRHPMHTGWTLSAHDIPEHSAAAQLPPSIPAQVPGSVHTDLLAAGLIADPYLDENELTLDWIGRVGWRYATRFDTCGLAGRALEDGECIDLVCEGLDTVAELELNGRQLGMTENMHRTYRFAMEDRLVAGDNSLAVTFTSALDHAERVRDDLGDRPNAYPMPFNFIRKMACNFGWDWGPSLVTAGIWRPISLQLWRVARLDRVRPVVAIAGPSGSVRVEVDLEWAHHRHGRAVDDDAQCGLSLQAEIAGVTRTVAVGFGQSAVTLHLNVDSPQLWWPQGLGGQRRYPLTLVLRAADGSELDRWERRIGFRSVRLDTSADETGSAFTLVVNDVPVFTRGANWIPDDCFPSRITPQRYRDRIEQAAQANINLLRVWGGGIYESDDFYDVCDELGIMVWQDFLFACAAYPEDEPIRSEVAAEARDNVARLMPHPSLVLWNGNNENIWGWFDWGWQEPLAGRTWGLGYYLELLPKVVAEVDPSRTYWPGSPYAGSMAIHPNDEAHGPAHSWVVWNERDYTEYAHHVPRFVSEFGFQGPPTWATVTRAIHDEPLSATSAGMLLHQKATDGNAKLQRSLDAHLRPAEDFDDWFFQTQLNQARAVAFGVEHWRSHRPRCMGTVVWQLNDCWPVTSWAAIDGDGRLKPLWYALRNSYAPRLLTIQPRDGGLTVIGVNDSGASWRGPLTIRRMTLDGDVLAEHHTRLVTDRFDSAQLAIPDRVARPTEPRREILVAQTLSGERALHLFAEDRDLPESPSFGIHLDSDEDRYRVTVTASTTVRDLCLFADRIHPDATVDDMLVTLLPGESHTFTLCSPVAVPKESLASKPVMRWANDSGT